MQIHTYTARDGTGRVLYEQQPAGNLIGALPLGSYPAPGGTLERVDGGDPFECAYFQPPGTAADDTASRITIRRDEEQKPLEIVVAVDWDNGAVRVFSNVKSLNVIMLDPGNRDPENTDRAEARLAADRLHEVAALTD